MISDYYFYAIAAGLFVIACLYSWLNTKWTRAIEQNSRRYKELLDLNKATKFDTTLKTNYKIEKRLKSKQAFDNFRYEKHMMEEIERQIDAYKKRLERLEYNRNLLETYTAALEQLPEPLSKEEAANLHIPPKRCWSLEEKCVKAAVLKPVVQFDVAYHTSYTSPKGKNRYRAQKVFHSADIQNLLDRIGQKEAHKNSQKYQRGLMTASLRYEILKRDGFRCVLCGKSAQDGAVLHVDHIKPVSKGGKTEPHNLRTLCEECNLGKSDRYEENGLN